MLANEIDCIVHSLKDVPTKLPPECAILIVGEREERRDCLAVNEGNYTWPGRRVEERGDTEGVDDDGDDDGDDDDGDKAEEGKKKRQGKIMIKSLRDLPPGAVVGTSSVRRTAMLRRHYPHLKTKDIRGNVGTRIRKLDASAPKSASASISAPTGPSTIPVDPGTTNPEFPPSSAQVQASEQLEPKPESQPEFDAALLASAGLTRLNLSHRIACLLTPQNSGLLPAVGQGALGVEIRSKDLTTNHIGAATAKCVKKEVSYCALAERAMLRVLEGGCSVPVGVDTSYFDDDDNNHDEKDSRGELKITAAVVSLDGSDSVEGQLTKRVGSDEEAEEAGMQMARDLIAKGAERILKDITLNRTKIQEEGGA